MLGDCRKPQDAAEGGPDRGGAAAVSNGVTFPARRAGPLRWEAPGLDVRGHRGRRGLGWDCGLFSESHGGGSPVESFPRTNAQVTLPETGLLRPNKGLL